MLQVSAQSIPFERCEKSPTYPFGHCFHGVFYGGPITNTARCCWCGKMQEMPWSYNPEPLHGPHHPMRGAPETQEAKHGE